MKWYVDDINRKLYEIYIRVNLTVSPPLFPFVPAKWYKVILTLLLEQPPWLGLGTL